MAFLNELTENASVAIMVAVCSTSSTRRGQLCGRFGPCITCQLQVCAVRSERTTFHERSARSKILFSLLFFCQWGANLFPGLEGWGDVGVLCAVSHTFMPNASAGSCDSHPIQCSLFFFLMQCHARHCGAVARCHARVTFLHPKRWEGHATAR